MAVSAPSYQPAAVPVAVGAGVVRIQNAELDAQSRLHGTARTASGWAVPDAQITLLDRDGNVIAVTSTGQDGRYKFDNLPRGEYTVVASGYAPAASRFAITSSRPHYHEVKLAHPEPGVAGQRPSAGAR